MSSRAVASSSMTRTRSAVGERRPSEPVELLGSERVRAGDVVLAMASSGIHSNGYSLVRHILATTDLTLKFHVSACNGRSVEGASVYATAVPFEQFSTPAEVTTDASGWATITLHRASRFLQTRGLHQAHALARGLGGEKQRGGDLAGCQRIARGLR